MKLKIKPGIPETRNRNPDKRPSLLSQASSNRSQSLKENTSKHTMDLRPKPNIRETINKRISMMPQDSDQKGHRPHSANSIRT